METKVNVFTCDLPCGGLRPYMNMIYFVDRGTSVSISVPAIEWSHFTCWLFEHGIFFLGFFRFFFVTILSCAFSCAQWSVPCPALAASIAVLSTPSPEVPKARLHGPLSNLLPLVEGVPWQGGGMRSSSRSLPAQPIVWPLGTSPHHGGSSNHCLHFSHKGHASVLFRWCPSPGSSSSSAVSSFQLFQLSAPPWFVLFQIQFSLSIFSAACSRCAGTRSSRILGVVTSQALTLLPAALGGRGREHPAQPLLSQAGVCSVNTIF